MGKRRAIIFVFVCALVLLAGCAGGSPQNGAQAMELDTFLVGKAVQKAQLIGEMAASSDVMAPYVNGLSPETMDAVHRYAGFDMGAPRKAVVWHITGAQAVERALMQEGVNRAGIADELAETLSNRVYLTLPNRVNAMTGMAQIAAASLLSVSSACQRPAGFGGPAIVLLIYGETAAVACVFVESEDDTLMISSMPLYADAEFLAALESNGQGGAAGVWAPYIDGMDVKAYTDGELGAMLPRAGTT